MNTKVPHLCRDFLYQAVGEFLVDGDGTPFQHGWSHGIHLTLSTPQATHQGLLKQQWDLAADVLLLLLLTLLLHFVFLKSDFFVSEKEESGS
jgi:hypothetical protein